MDRKPVESISLDDLDLNLDHLPDKPTSSRDPDVQAAIDRVRQEMLEEAGKAEPPRAQPKWHATAVVLVVNRFTCTCGAQYESPAAPEPLVRFKHKNGSIREAAYHPSLTNPELPHEVRRLERKVKICRACFAQREEGNNGTED